MMQEEIGRYIELKRKIHRGEALTFREQIDLKWLEVRHREMLNRRQEGHRKS